MVPKEKSAIVVDYILGNGFKTCKEKFSTKNKKFKYTTKDKIKIPNTFILNMTTSTKLCHNTHVKIQLRHYPGPKINIKDIAKFTPFKNDFVHNNPQTALVIYDPKQSEKWLALKELQIRAYRNSIGMSPKIFPLSNINKKPDPKFDKEIKSLTVAIQNIINYNICANPKQAISEALNNKALPPTSLEAILSTLNNVEKLSEEQKTTLVILRSYFLKYPPTITQGNIFLTLWEKSNQEFQPLTFQNNSEKSLPLTKTKENVETTTVLNKNTTFEEKKQVALHEKTKYVKLMNDLFHQYAKNPQEIFKDQQLALWYTFIRNKTKVLPYSAEEIAINNKLRDLYKLFAPKEEDLLQQKRDRFKKLKEESQLPEIVKTFDEEPCMTPDDYAKALSKAQQTLDSLMSTENLSIEDLKILALNSSAAVLDDEGTFKLTQETYKSYAQNASKLNFQYLASYPQRASILHKIKNKEFIVANETKILPEGFLIQPAHLSHKTLIIFDENLGKNIMVQIGILTSTKDDTSIKLDNYQQTNPDPEKQTKSQMFRILGNFMVVDADNDLTIDVETTLMLKNRNSNNEIISDLLYDEYNLKKDIWSQKFYQMPYKADDVFLRNIAKIFIEQKINTIEKQIQKFKDLQKQDPVQYHDMIKQLSNDKQLLIKEKERQRYFSLLPDEFKELYLTLKLFEELLLQDKIQAKATQKKQEINKRLDLSKKNKEEEEKHKAEKTAKEKKEEYLKAKQANAENITTNYDKQNT